MLSAGTPPSTSRSSVDRDVLLQRLKGVGVLRNTHPNFKHGRIYTGPPQQPTMAWKSTQPPRDDHDAPAWLTATEFKDTDAALEAKVKHLAELMRASKKTVIYSGAGISASVIGQAARSGSIKVGFKPNTRAALPTPTHLALRALERAGFIQSWQQQNHDGLPQKAGYPQDKINEIHGSWYDPCNPVVKYSGSLHDRAFPWMLSDAATADLTLVLGTSMGGLTADCVATDPANRSRSGMALGAVCINLQQTAQDGIMSLRVFEKTDVVMLRLLHELGIEIPTDSNLCEVGLPGNRVLVPYDRDGRRLSPTAMARSDWMVLDLSARMAVKINPDHNIQGARQPMYMHIGATKPHRFKGQTRSPRVGYGVVQERDDETCSYVCNVEGAVMRLGTWWLRAAAAGKVEALPIVNRQPVFFPRGTKVDTKASKNCKAPLNQRNTTLARTPRPKTRAAGARANSGKAKPDTQTGMPSGNLTLPPVTTASAGKGSPKATGGSAKKAFAAKAAKAAKAPGTPKSGCSSKSKAKAGRQAMQLGKSVFGASLFDAVGAPSGDGTADPTHIVFYGSSLLQ